ncbi:PucR family transcriptional regulator [Salinithrix halophila]|uniref:PucR family transcriptional regulator n=1 Tax=Salinithrix halophila TaxID=1485204 RepID=A0ABV8JJ04_9BACL
MQEPMTVTEVLKRPHFQHAKVVAGAEGLERPVRWVHVLEIMDGSSYVHGHELILMTGVGLGEEKELHLQFVRELVASDVSALCIELVHQYVRLPESIKQFADQHRFPIIVFEKAVSFIGITQDIHAFLINRHHHQLLSLERISNQFLQLTLRPRGAAQILKLLHEETGCRVWLKDHLGENLVYPEDQPLSEGASLIRQPIVALGVEVGDLLIEYSGEPPEILRLVLDRAATAIAQELLRRISLEERQLRDGRQWMDDLLSRGVAEVPSVVTAGVHAGCRMVIGAVKCIAREGTTTDTGHILEEEANMAILQWARSVPQVFEPLGIRSWTVTLGKNQVVMMMGRHPSSAAALMKRIRQGLSRLFQRLGESPPASRFEWRAGISHAFSALDQAPQAWQQASLALSIPQGSEKQKPGTPKGEASEVICYDDLQSWQLFLQVSPVVLTEYVESQLGTLLAHDRKNGTDLVNTLDAFLDARQSKQQAAKDLFIHRQTLYYRLEQITSLLGEGWESSPRRFALDMALAARRFLESRNASFSLQAQRNPTPES